MFFSTYVLTKKGPLAKVWLAAHWDRRLTRNEVKVVDLSRTIMHIVRPVVPIALRTSGELLVGVVRIYVLKVRHLLKEATEATLFLRVSTTSTTKGSANSATASAAADEKAATTMDGVLVRGKGDVEAVTFDWNGDAAAKHGGAPAAAEALREARFDAIADLLGAQHVSGAGDGGGLLAQAWYTVEPSSQAAEELHNTQQDYDEIAKMRADLMAFGDRTSGSSASKSKSSLSSIEKGRGSAFDGGAATGGVLGGDVPFPAVTDELDIGVPVPDELTSNVPLLGTQGAALPDDPFAVPDVLSAGAARGERKVRPVNVLDLAATTLPREVFEKCMADRSDTVNAEPRRGPLDEQEAADRCIITCTPNPLDAAAALSPSPSASAAATLGEASGGILSIADAALLSSQPNPSLRAAFAAVLQQQVAEAVEEAVRASRGVAARSSEVTATAVPEEDEAAVAAAEREVQEPHSTRKRVRDDAESDDPGSLSASAVQTLQRIRTEALRVSRRRTRAEAASASLVGAACTLSGVCTGLHRRDAARAFVDVLALASKQLVGVRQEATGGDIEIQLLRASASVPVS